MSLTPDDFENGLGSLLARADSLDIADYKLLRLAGDRPPWTGSGMTLKRGERLSIFSAGRIQLADNPGVWVGAHFALWMRVGEQGEIFRAGGASISFVADREGQLYLGNGFPGQWADRCGGLATPPDIYASVNGTLAVLIVRWKADPLKGLKRLVQSGDVAGLLAGEITRLISPVVAPAGWRYLWSLGDSGSFSTLPDGSPGRAVRCRIRDDAAILQRPISIPFLPGTRLRWRWNLEALASTRREDVLAHHDYLSVAVEFDNGQDLTYFWSAELPLEFSFSCPIKGWHERETHLVVRSGSDGLGRWIPEDRDLYRDYQRTVGQPPSTIVAVWLIAVSIFQHGEGRADFADLELTTGECVWPLFDWGSSK